MNEYFNNTSNPQPNSSGSSSLIRAEFASIKAGFDKLPTIAGNGGEFVRINAGATALETTGDVVASLTVAATGKTTPVDADLVPLVDSEASNVLKKLTWANLKATLKTYFDSVTTTLTNKTLTTPVLSNPSYSGTTANGGTVTTIDINGGTIDGTAIGSTTPAAGSFTTLSVKSGTLGYGVGAGISVIQSTSKSTAVEANKPSGRITMNNAALAAGAPVSFLVTNSFVAATDTVALSLVGGFSGATTDYALSSYTLGGSLVIGVRNVSAGSLSEALQIQFAVVKGATS